jgi:DNA-binding response OmpR family regulator
MRILIIEDNKEIRNSLKIALESEMFYVDVADDGESGSYLARTNDYDLIVLDNMLPKKAGAEVCYEIRRAGRKTPIILISILSESDEKTRLLDIGADDYVSKPFSFKELLARIRALLRRPETVVPEVLSTGDIVLNSRTHEVKRGSKNIYLTKKEYALLELLIRNCGNIVSRGIIMEHIWDIDGNPFSNTIETHIFNLRKKIEKGKDRLIWNVPGRGYKIVSL